ncbi:ATP synthase protein I [Methylomarinovum tepidoasis]|uniref:ATP synthase protein I n=1 Tax=Methylomarinovum tepidoasis TaxID=2840183 RepID=A0AAU9CF50_9GAMM|nr:AtpZ/AtpI family protein [Methylomarinovum sp. IN45]BCX87846.1 ATP synthase protein I [Methylomarinovum sp. IN45]
MSDASRPDPPEDEARLLREVDKKVRRRLKAEREGRRGLWFGLGMFGLVGWSVAIPTLLGIALGWWLDRRFPGPPSWTLTFLFLGVALGCYNAWQWIRRESRRDD